MQLVVATLSPLLDVQLYRALLGQQAVVDPGRDGRTDCRKKASEGSGPMYVCDVNQREIDPNKEVERIKRKVGIYSAHRQLHEAACKI